MTMGGGSLGRNWLAGACLPGLALMSVTSPRPSCKTMTNYFHRCLIFRAVRAVQARNDTKKRDDWKSFVYYYSLTACSISKTFERLEWHSFYRKRISQGPWMITTMTKLYAPWVNYTRISIDRNYITWCLVLRVVRNYSVLENCTF